MGNNNLKDKIIEFLKKYHRNDYQRDNFDSFLKKIKFQYNVPSIHIAGTNGKGSTANFISSIYEAKGYKVGLFSSPYFYYPNEMIKINHFDIPDEVFYSYLMKFEKQFSKYQLSNFEIETFIALNYFLDEHVDIAIIECGMGGEDDATNIFTPILSIITSISLEHTEFLGRSIAEIAFQKAGIIKDKVPVLISNKLNEEALNVIKEVARLKKSNIFQIHETAFEEITNNGYKFTYSPFKDLFINFESFYSIIDACLAVDAVLLLKNSFPISESNIYDGLKNMRLSGRMEIVCQNPLVFVDGAHNPEGAESLRNSLEKIQNGRNIRIIFACFKDKNIERMLAEFNFISRDITLTSFPHYRARKEADYFLFLEEYKFNPDYKALIRQEINESKDSDDIIVITGSLAFASFALKLFNEDNLCKQN